MRVCMVAYTFYEGDNRVRRYAETLVKRGDSVDVIALRQKGSAQCATVSNVNVYKIQGRSINEKLKIEYLFKLLLFLFRSFWVLTKLNMRKKYDLIHVHSVPDFEVFAALGAKLTGAKVILDIHDIVPELYSGKFHTSKKSIFFRMLLWVEKLSMTFADHIIVANHIWHKRLLSRSVGARKCTVVMNYPDPGIFNVKRPAKISDDRLIMIYPGTLSIHQGLETAIKAVDSLKEEIPQLQFHIYGKGTDEQYFVNMVEQLGLSSRIFFKGIVPIEMLPSILGSADLGVEPKLKNSFGNEAFSTKILEFMVMGVPVIASDTMVHTYYFDDSMVKFFKSEDHLDLARCIKLLQKDRFVRESLVQNGYRFINENNWDVKKHTYINLVNKLVSNKQSV